MIEAHFLSKPERKALVLLCKSGKVEHRIARRANALLLLDRGMSCEAVADLLFIDDDTVRTWWKIHGKEGLEGLKNFDVGGSAGELDNAQVACLVEWIDGANPKGTKVIGTWIKRNFAVSYTRSGLVKLLQRAGIAFRKPVLVPRKIDAEAQRAFIREYESLMNGLWPDEMVVFIDAVHPAHQVRATGCWVRNDAPPLAVSANSGRDNLNIHGAIDLSTGQTVMIDALRIDETTTIALLERIEARNPNIRRIVAYADNAAYHKTQKVKDWLKQPGRRIEMRFIPVYCPHLNPIERLWGVMHKNVTHNRCYATRREFCDAVLKFLRETVPSEFRRFCGRISDNFRIIDASEFRVLT